MAPQSETSGDRDALAVNPAGSAADGSASAAGAGEALLEASLLRVATTLGAAPELEELLAALGGALSVLDGYVWGGLAVFDSRRNAATVYDATGAPRLTRPVAVGTGQEGLTLDAGETDAAALVASADGRVSRDLGRERSRPIDYRLFDAGVQRYECMAIRMRGELLGWLCVGFASSAAPAACVVRFLDRLARVISAAFWSFRTHARLVRGDRRRATLTELSHAINTSLKLETVIESARQAVARLEGHLVSQIGLLDGENETLRVYRQVSRPDGTAVIRSDAERLAVGDTAMVWMLDRHQTYESDDLSQRTRFASDARLRELGVRRYVAAPMYARGRIVGMFLFGTAEPHAIMSTDVWLCENIALQLALAIDNATQYEQLRQLSERLAEQNVYLREEIQSAHNLGEIVGGSPAMQRVFDAIARVAATNATVLIQGETGVGKELVARAIHARSDRADQPLVKVNCAAIPEGLVESELFGHERGAFTSATSRRIGRFELARDGTLFLDEVGELSLGVQSKLLRVLQDGDFERVGGVHTLRTNARIIAATNRDLLRAVHAGTFRSDLYYRLNVFPIEVPPLSARPEDIPRLVERFIQQCNRRMGKEVASIERESLEYLCRRDWPGNVRELQHVIERSMILCDGPVLRVEPTMHAPRRPADPPAGASVPLGQGIADRRTSESVGTLREMEREHIRQALRRTRGVVEGPRGAAAILGIKPSTLRFRMKRLGIKRPVDELADS